MEIFPLLVDALDGITPNMEVVVLTWLHLARRDVMKVHPRGETSNPLRGVFTRRSPDRPNPIWLHRTRVVEVDKLLRTVADSQDKEQQSSTELSFATIDAFFPSFSVAYIAEASDPCKQSTNRTSNVTIGKPPTSVEGRRCFETFRC